MKHARFVMIDPNNGVIVLIHGQDSFSQSCDQQKPSSNELRGPHDQFGSNLSESGVKRGGGGGRVSRSRGSGCAEDSCIYDLSVVAKDFGRKLHFSLWCGRKRELETSDVNEKLPA